MTANAYFLESIPRDLVDLRSENTLYTEQKLIDLVDETTQYLDIMAMYWELLPSEENKLVFSETQLYTLGAPYGRMLYEALDNAAGRGVKIRIVQNGDWYSGTHPELEALLEKHSNNITVYTVKMTDWYATGVMHQKVWIFDQTIAYLGSANMDWKALTQVKELGIVVENETTIIADLLSYFDNWIQLSAIEIPQTVQFFDQRFQVKRQVPAWSLQVQEEDRIQSPLNQNTSSFGIDSPMKVDLNGESSEAFITGAPQEICTNGRSFDSDGILYTLQDAQKSICLSMMDFAPTSFYNKSNIWWGDLFNALVQAVTTKNIHVRLLISHWANSRPIIDSYLRALETTAKASKADLYTSAGKLEIKRFIMPGWNRTSGLQAIFPPFSRVNHTKFIVTDRRLNIGTSNLTWDYFYSTAGTSFNCNNLGLVDNLQAIFDRDWQSNYAHDFI